MTTPNETANPAPKPERKAPKISAGAVVSALAVLLVEILLPVLIAGGLIWYLFASYNLWALDRTLAIVLFGAAVVIVALVISVLLDTLLSGFRAGYARQGARFSNNASLRMVKMAIGGVVLPVAAILGANLVAIPNSGTAMTVLIDLAQRPIANTPAGEVGKVILSAGNPTTQLSGISVLQSFNSPEALTVLVQIASDDKEALTNPAVSAALAKAIGSYGLQAKPLLLKLFNAIDPATVNKAPAADSGLYERYFSGAFESLQADAVLDTVDPAAREARIAHIQAAQAQLKSALADLDSSAASAQGADPRLDFVLQAFLASELTSDKDLLAFAKTTAADTRYSSQVRGDALLLTAKLGDKNDLDGLFPYLHGGDDLLQARALRAIFNLQDKIKNTVGK